MSKDDDDYDEALEAHQLALVQWQEWAMKKGQKALILFEGRDAAGKDGSIRVITEHLSVRNTRVVALPKPTDRDKSLWYFQRYVRYLPAAGETVILNRSWYNRAGVERVMGFATPREQEVFMRDVPRFETMLLESELNLVKLWLDVSKKEQAARLKDRRTDPLKVLKSSPMDAAAQEKWDDYTRARDEMLTRTHTPEAPWTVVHTDSKPKARMNIMRHMLKALAPKPIAKEIPAPDSDVLYEFEPTAVKDGRLEH